ncbi:MAG: hypothetical protein LBI53_05730 [Candidatus Peribacteria bacterium]|nr:hypothetical protein [Candidatus Peribacteria bacterium]
MGEEIEKYLNKVFLDKLQMNIPKPAFAELKQRIHTNDSLSTRCKEIQHFLDECAEETKSLNVSSITINNQSIANHLEKEGKIEKEKIHTLSQTEFKKAMDALVSRTMTPRLNKYAQEYLKLEKDIQNTCQNAFPLLGSIIQQTPFNIKKLRQEDSTLDTKLVQLETSLHSANTKEERDSITAEIQNTHRETYKKEIEKTDPNIAQIVQKLRDNNFDYSTLAPQEMQELIKKTAEQRCKIARERGFTDNLIGEEQKLKTFINDLTDPNKTKIEIDGMIIPITNKQIKT